MSDVAAPVAAPPTRGARFLAAAKAFPRRFLTFVWDNPSAEHDARTILSSPKVGLWLGIEILLILLACGFSLYLLPIMDSAFRRLAVSVGMGNYLVATTLLILTGFLTLIVPLRASGLMEGPRWRGYMDQLVTTGMSPLRYYAGKWATSQPFFVVLLAASIPFIVLFGLLGEISWTRTAVSYLVLYAYCNLLLLVAFGLGAVMHEVLALLATWSLFITALIIEFTPVPSSLAAFTPVRFVIYPFVEAMAGSEANIAQPLYGTANLFGVGFPWPVYALGLWTLIGLLVVVTCTLGPLHAYVPGLNNFGAVVLPGDRKRNFFRRLRPFLKRRTELAFLFENRGPRLVRWHLPVRALQQVVVLSLGGLLYYSVVFDPTLLSITHRRGVLVLHGMATGFALAGCLFVFSSGRIDALQRFKLGRFGIPQVAFDTATFLWFLAALVVIHVVGFSAGWNDLVTSRMSFWSPMTPEETYVRCSLNMAVIVTHTMAVFLFLKVVGARILSRVGVYVLGLVFILGVNLLPLIAMGFGNALHYSGDPLLARLAPPFMVIGEISPTVAIIVNDGDLPRWARSADSWIVKQGFWIWHVPLILYLAWLALVNHRSLAREAAVLAGDAPSGADAEGPPCMSCRSRRRVPTGSTWWGGWLITRIAGTVRCVDCREEYSPATGRRSHRAIFLGAFVRSLLMFIAACLGFWLLLGAFL